MRVNSVIMAVIIGFIKLTAISTIFCSAEKIVAERRALLKMLVNGDNDNNGTIISTTTK